MVESNLNSEKCILCIDDEAGTLSALERILRPLRYKVLTATEGRKGVELAMANRPSLIFLDVHMPMMDGYAVLKELQEQGLRAVPVVMLTGDKSNESIVKGYFAGSTYYITKPFKNDYIRNIVEYLIGDLSEEKRSELELKL